MFYIALILIIFFLDLKVKEYIEENKEMHKSEEILNGKIILERYHNKGAMLNFLEHNVQLVKIISLSLFGILLLFFAFLLPKKDNRILKLALSLILGGALSNIYDRVKKGYVVDYFSFKFLKKVVFNISDICIFIGSFIIVLLSFFKNE
ncbi:signal peptidase II [Anaerocolumna sp.]|uniref:signal peptidase II n=1 Tax=Anaerocolumna sp. TaxID=2041569 RepID=UPI0028A6C68D|nr:signal peptidase II [Anaerocolumna sp.]